MQYAPDNTPYWQPKLGELGEIVAGIEEHEQAIRLVLLTPFGSIPLEPTFGCDLIDHIDKPTPKAIVAIIRCVTKALIKWVPQITLTAPITIIPQPNNTGVAALEIEWKPTDPIYSGPDLKTEVKLWL